MRRFVPSPGGWATSACRTSRPSDCDGGPKSPTKTTGFFRVATDRRATWDLAEGTARARGADGAPQRAGWAESKALALWWRRQTPTSSAWRRGGREPTARFSTPETHGTGRSRRSAQRAPGTLRWQAAPPSPCRLRARTAAFESVFSSVFSALRSLLGRQPGTRTFVYVPSFFSQHSGRIPHVGGLRCSSALGMGQTHSPASLRPLTRRRRPLRGCVGWTSVCASRCCQRHGIAGPPSGHTFTEATRLRTP